MSKEGKGKKVLITVNTIQTNELGERDSINFQTIGSLYSKNQAIYLIYDESVLTGMAGSTTSLKVEPEKITLSRMGNSQLKHTFEAGVVNSGTYVTPYGTMTTKVLPSKVAADLTENGGSINLEYELIVGKDKIGVNELLITVKEA
ncbi:DUF1934 domain-containing protein [Peptococcaceae bacterium 1198_IL3148]